MSKTKANSNGKPSKRSGAISPATIPIRAGQGGGVSEAVDESANAEAELPETTPPPRPASDFPRPSVLVKPTTCRWDEDAPIHQNYIALGAALARSGDIYRDANYGGGLFLASPSPAVPPKAITNAGDLAAIIADRVQIEVFKGDVLKGRKVSQTDLKIMLLAETFLQQFHVVDRVVKVPCYLPDFTLVVPGYNDGGHGQRIFYAGAPARTATTHDAIDTFLDVMEFTSNADRTNTIAGALTVQFRNLFLGEKPILAFTSTKSHGGKDTLVEFCAGKTQRISLSYETSDWALQKNFAAAVECNPDVGVINIENVRPGKNHTAMQSAFLERFITDPEPILYSTGTGNSRPRKNDLVVTTTTNYANLSEDLNNRALPISLAPIGDVAARKSPIGNPRFEYLPKHGKQIEAEVHGMVEAWKLAGMPLDEDVKHPFTAWAKTIGGILQVAGYEDFLANYSLRKTADDPIRKALGILGAAMPNTWQRPDDWARDVRKQGLTKTLISEADRETPVSRCRGVGVVLSRHENEVFRVETDDESLTLQLKKSRRRLNGSEPKTCYKFCVQKPEPVSEDADPPKVTPLPSD